MTTNKEALQKIFEAALKEAETTPITKTRKFASAEHLAKPHHPIGPATTSSQPQMMPQAVPDAAVTPSTAKPSAPEVAPAATVAAATPPVTPDHNHDAASAGPAAVLDRKTAKDKRRHQMQWLVLSAVLVGGLGGSAAWFIQSPERIDSLKSASTEVKAATDVQSLTGEYQKSLDEVAVRGSQPDQATAARAHSMQAAFGEQAKKTGTTPQPGTQITADNSFVPSD